MAGFSLLLSACSDPVETPEDQLRTFIDAGELAVEERSLQKSAGLIADDYKDGQGSDKRAISRLLFAYFARHQKIHLLTHISSIELSSERDWGRLVLFVAMAGAPIESLASLERIRADLYRFDLDVVRNDGEWLLQRAKWQRATLNDLMTE
jgi:hypothetical protein